MIRAVCVGLCLLLVSAVAFHFWRVSALQTDLAAAVAAKADLERKLSAAALKALSDSLTASDETITKRDADHDSIRDAGTVAQDNIASIPTQSCFDDDFPAALDDELHSLYRTASAIGAGSCAGDAPGDPVRVQAATGTAAKAPDASLNSKVAGEVHGVGR